MHNHRRFLAAASIAAVLTLTGCKQETVVAGPYDPQAEQLAKAKPVTLPPSISASRAYRCKDNSLVYVDFYNDQKTATFRSKKGGDAVSLTAGEAGKPYVYDGYSVTGSGAEITLTAPGKGTQSCKA